MRVRGALVLLAVVLAAQPLAAQTIYGANGSSIVEIDASSGAQTTVAGGVTSYFGISTFDAAGKRLFFTGPGGPGTVLWSMDVGTGAVRQIPLTGTYAFVEYDPVSGKLYAASGTSIVQIDPNTGSQTVVASGITAIFGISTFDVAGRRLLFTGFSGSGTVLWSVNVTSGSVTQVALSSTYAFVEFDAISGKLYAVNGSTIVEINPNTGTETVVASGVTAYFGISTFDAVGRKLFFTGTAGAGTVLWSLNVATGEVRQVALAGSPAFIEVAGVAIGIPLLGHTALLLLVLGVAMIAMVRLSV